MFENWGAMMNVNNDLICSFEVIKQNKPKTNGSKKRPKTPKYIN